MKEIDPRERFQPVFNGMKWWVVDKQGGWYEAGNENAAHDKAARWNYEYEERLDGLSRFTTSDDG